MEKSKNCSKCKKHKPLYEFHRSSKASDGHASWCKICANSAARVRNKRDYKPADKRRWQLKTRYGIEPSEFDAMLSAQGGVCALCDATLKVPHIDHCHNTGKVRGLLCHRCNIRLGGWDDLPWRERALGYLGINGQSERVAA